MGIVSLERVLAVATDHWVEVLMLCASAFGTVLLTVVLCSRRRSVDWTSFSRCESGGLSEELVLVFPFFVLFLGMTIQMALLFNARLMVNYAAFVAGRSASVWIPAKTGSEPSNRVRMRVEDPKSSQ